MGVKIVEVIEGSREARGMSRAKMAEEMERESGEPWDKERLDKALNGEFCPRAETLFLMLKVVGMAAYPWRWCRSKRSARDDD